MNKHFLLLFNSARAALFLAFLFVIAASPALAQQETAPATLTGFTLSPTAVDTTTSPATVNVTVQATSDLSPVDFVSVCYESPANDHWGWLRDRAGQVVNGCITPTCSVLAKV